MATVSPARTREQDLEPQDLIRKSRLVHRAGRLALAAGHGSYRVKSHMQRVGSAVGLDVVQAGVSLTEITSTSERDGIFRTEVSEVRPLGINADRLAELEHYIGNLPPRVPSAQISAELDRIAAKKPLYSTLASALAAGVACAAFAFLNGGGLVECLVVLVAAFGGQYIRRLLLHRNINQVAVTLLVAALASLIYLGLVTLITHIFGGVGQHIAGYTSAVLFLVPGFPLVTGCMDLARLDLSAGISRLTYALVILGTAGIAVWAVSAVVGLEPQPMTGGDMTPVLLWTLRAVMSFLAVFGFAVLFNSPLRMALGAALIGMLANVLRLVAVNIWHWEPQAAAFLAALVVGLLARAIATPLGVPRITISVPAVVIMVPGVLAYRAIFEVNAGSTLTAIGFGVEAALVVLALAVGLGVARMLTDKEWTIE